MRPGLIRIGVAVARQWRGVTSVAAVAAGLLAGAAGLTSGFDHAARAVRDSVRSHPASGEVQIVEIDANSLEKLDKWPWPRGHYARAVDALRAAGVRNIAFDVDFSSRSDAGEDARLAAALQRAGGAVILPTFRQLAGAGDRRVVENVPIAPLRENAFLAGVTIRPDRDGVVRQAPLGVVTGGRPRPSLSAMVAEASSSAGDFFAIDFAIEPRTIPRHSFVDLIEGRIPPDQLRGSRIIIGATAIETGDRYTVPRFGVIPGVVVQALAAETLLQDGVPNQFGPVLPLCLAALGAFGLAFARRRMVRAGVFAGALAAVTLGSLASEALFTASFAIGPAMVVLVLAAAFAVGFKVLRLFLQRLLTDVSTNLPNLASLALDGRSEDAPGIAVARIDNFVSLSSGIGQGATSELVKQVADRLALACGGAPIYRVDDSSLAWRIAGADPCGFDDRFEGIDSLMRAPVHCGGRSIDVALHFGLAEREGASVAQLAADALLAATRAKTSGLRWEQFLAGSAEETQWRLSLLGQLDEALAAGDIWVAYQPKLDIAGSRIAGVEALARWDHPSRGTIRPDHFIPFVEESDRMMQLTDYVLRTALRDALRMRGELTVAVNIAANLLARPGLVELVRSGLAQSGVAPERLTLEITESAAMVDPDAALATLRELAALGLKLSIDDYGTGQSTLSYLKRLPARELKIDKSFIQSITLNHGDAILVGSTINLAHELGMTVVAEGVEDRACLERLEQMGCDLAQGYLIGRPMRIDELMAASEGELRRAA